MKRAAPLRRRGRITRRAQLRRSTARRAVQRALNPLVYAAVDQRSGGRCETQLTGPGLTLWVCGRRAVDHHHTRKPRRSWHTPAYVVHLCRLCHDRCAAPYRSGRLVITPLGSERFTFTIVTAADRDEARRRADGG